jgi:hypothetical protein
MQHKNTKVLLNELVGSNPDIAFLNEHQIANSLIKQNLGFWAVYRIS